MTAYVIFMREGAIRDPDAMARYQAKNRENVGDFKVKPLAIYGKLETLEGISPDGVIVLEFPSVEDAKAWYESPGYQAAIPLRQAAADYRVVIVEGL